MTRQLCRSNVSRPNSALGRGGIRNPIPRCVELANQRLRRLCHRSSHRCFISFAVWIVGLSHLVFLSFRIFFYITFVLVFFCPCSLPIAHYSPVSRYLLSCTHTCSSFWLICPYIFNPACLFSSLLDCYVWISCYRTLFDLLDYDSWTVFCFVLCCVLLLVWTAFPCLTYCLPHQLRICLPALFLIAGFLLLPVLTTNRWIKMPTLPRTGLQLVPLLPNRDLIYTGICLSKLCPINSVCHRGLQY